MPDAGAATPGRPAPRMSPQTAFANLQRTLLDFRQDLVRLRERRRHRSLRLSGLLGAKLELRRSSSAEASAAAAALSASSPAALVPTPPTPPRKLPQLPADELRGPESATSSPGRNGRGGFLPFGGASEAGSVDTDPEMPQLEPASPPLKGFPNLDDKLVESRRTELPLAELGLTSGWDNDEPDDGEATPEEDEDEEFRTVKADPLNSCWRKGALAAALKGLGGC